MKIESLDHLVLTVASIEITCAFYAEVMGMRVETFAESRKALHFGDQKINLHLAGQEVLVVPDLDQESRTEQQRQNRQADLPFQRSGTDKINQP